MTRCNISVVIASLVGEPFIDECLESLEQQAKDCGAEVIVVASGSEQNSLRLAKKFAWVRVIPLVERHTVPDLRRRGVEAASGEIVAIIEEHCRAAPDWLERARDALSKGEYGVAGGPVADSGYNRLVDWAVYFCEYNSYLPPWEKGQWHDVGSANIAYRQSVLLEYAGQLGAGYWEAALHPRLMADGVKFRPEPAMIVYHCGPFAYGYYLNQRYWFSRAFAGARKLSAAHKLAYCIASPIVPFLLIGRMARRIFHAGCHKGKFLQSVPLLVPVLFVYVAGELVGYLAGPGAALLKVE